MTITPVSKRHILRLGGTLGGTVAAALAAPALLIRPAVAGPADNRAKAEPADQGHAPVTPAEDLMREHGVLDRVLLLYEAGLRKFSASEDFDPALITQSAVIVRDFINDYHEKSEEDYVFPRFRKAGKQVALVDTLERQHQAGRKATEIIIGLSPSSRANQDDRRRLVSVMQAFIVMYRPHAAREDTDLFPELKELVSPSEYAALGEEFEKKEHLLFGDDGHDKILTQVAALEQKMGIDQLDQFTPKL